MNLTDKLGKELIFFDGAMGTQLQLRGLAGGELPERWNLTHADSVIEIHRSYLEAGCNVLKTNTFGANRYKLSGSGLSTDETVNAAIRNARTAAVGFDGCAVALDIGPLGKLLEPVGELSFDEAYEAFSETVRAGADKCDLILFETFTDTYEMKAAVLAAKENSSLPVIVTAAFDEDGRLLCGADVDCVTALLEGLGADAIGFNCGVGPKQLKRLLPRMVQVSSLPVVCNPNAGLPHTEGERTVYDLPPEEFARDIGELVRMGACAVGGCCGTTPAHLSAMTRLCRGMEVRPAENKGLSAVCSYSNTVYLGKKPVVIGERINPTGKPKFKQALRDGNIAYLLGEATAQQDSGADVLDINVGLPEIDEEGLLCAAVKAVQGVTPLPLQIDTMNTAAMENALRHCNGKPMINSVNGKRECLESVLPLAKKYGGVLVCLTLDENGIPETADGRVAIARRIADTAEKYGIDRKNLIIDPLTIAVSTDPAAASVTLDALERIKSELKLNTVLGVSNVSFGLPQRERINTAFFVMALARGLSAGIINPLSEGMMSAYRSFCALCGEDEGCAGYIGAYSQSAAQAAPASGDMSLCAAIIKGLGSAAAEKTKALLESKGSLDIIDEDIIPALDEVGRGFEQKNLFLPQLLMSAQAAKEAFDVIKQAMAASADKQSKGTVALATVKGDVHDIGKNILKVLLENYGFNVTDLGRDVPPERIADTVCEKHIEIVGLSALMTTTVGAMKDTVELLRARAPWCRIMVGGAVLTQEYADMIGADFYSKDAMGGVRYCQKYFDSKK